MYRAQPGTARFTRPASGPARAAAGAAAIAVTAAPASREITGS